MGERTHWALAGVAQRRKPRLPWPTQQGWGSRAPESCQAKAFQPLFFSAPTAGTDLAASPSMQAASSPGQPSLATSRAKGESVHCRNEMRQERIKEKKKLPLSIPSLKAGVAPGRGSRWAQKSGFRSIFMTWGRLTISYY